MRVLLATDGSTDALAAARWLRDFPLPSTASFRVLTVVALPSPSLGLPRVGELHAELDAEGRRLAGETAKLLGPRAEAAETRALEGSPSAEIVRAAEAWPADLVVVGARGLGAG